MSCWMWKFQLYHHVTFNTSLWIAGFFPDCHTLFLSHSITGGNWNIILLQKDLEFFIFPWRDGRCASLHTIPCMFILYILYIRDIKLLYIVHTSELYAHWLHTFMKYLRAILVSFMCHPLNAFIGHYVNSFTVLWLHYISNINQFSENL